MKQIVNITALFLIAGFSLGFLAGSGYSVGLNPQVDSAQAVQKETFTARVTAYCQGPCCCGNSADGITANGHRIRPGEKFVAADRRYAFGTMLAIPGYNESRPVPVWDRGGAIKGNKLDVYFDSHKEALKWGVRNLQVSIER